jgi:ubiquinone/menaquinone biosynthesis C-methylase UbiE
MESEREKRWTKAQAKEDAFWQRENVLESQMGRVIARYKPVIDKISLGIPPDSVILDVGCGPTCAAQLFPSGLKIFLDPLMYSYKNTYSGTLPGGEMITCTAEKISMGNSCSDVVLCVNALDHMINPGEALSEIRRVLKDDGIFVLGLFLHPPPIAIARRFIERCLPFLREDAHPYSYTKKSTREMLKEYFSIHDEVKVYRKDTALIPSLHREDWLFICKKIVNVLI